MKKGTTIKLAALLLGAALILPACTGFSNNTQSGGEGSGQPTSESSQPGEQYTVAISNKEALQEEWPANGGNRKVEINVEPKANVAQLISEGKLSIESSDRAVLTIAGQMATPVAAGKATITVRSGESSDSVEVTIDPVKTNKDIYGTVHEGTADDPFDNEDAIKAAKKNIEDNLGGSFYIKGKVASFYHAPGSRTDGMVSWFLEPAQEGGEKFEVYKCLGADGKTPLTDDDIWVGGTAVAYGPFAVYNNQYETSSATFVSCEGNKPQPRTTVEATFAEALAAGKELADGADSYNYYEFSAFVTKNSGKNYFLTATKAEAITDEKENTIELYNVSDADAVAKLTKNAEVKVKIILKNYHGQVENLLAVAAADITVLQAGGTWEVIPEPAVEVRTLAEFIAGENTKAVAYKVTAKVKGFKDGGDTPEQYGNLVLTDDTNDLVIYGSTATATALVWNDADAYVFTNPKDFLTNEVTQAIQIGDEVTMKLIRADYKGAVQGTGIILSVGEGGGGEVPPEPVDVTAGLVASYDLSAYAGATYTQNDGKTAGLTEENALAIFNGGEESVVVKGANVVTAATGSKYYQAVSSQGPGTGLKLGTGSVEGYVQLTTACEIVKVVITVKAWSATKLATIKINDGTGTTLVADDFETAREISAVFEGTTTVKISSSIYSNIQSIALYAEAEYLFDCDGTTEELQAQFKRRYMSGSWQVDTSNANRYERDSEHAIEGTAMKRKGWNSGAVATNLNEDLEGKTGLRAFGFWVYNPGESDVGLRVWMYRGAGLTSNAELTNGSNSDSRAIAKAGQWTYVILYFDNTNFNAETKIYNFQIADFTNSNAALTFDNIALF